MSTTLTLSTGVEMTVERSGHGRPVLVIHGGGGPRSVAAIVEHLAGSHDTIAPTLPGWDGTDRPEWLRTVDDLALSLLAYLRAEDLHDVALVGSSIGGWIASAMAVFDSDAGRISRVILVDGVGAEIPGEPIPDFFGLSPREIAEYSYHDPDTFFVDPATVPAGLIERQRANIASLRIFAGEPYMHNPALLHRVKAVTVPVTGIWGDSDRIGTPAYGRAFLAAFPHSDFHLIEHAGHLPHIEQPGATFAVLDKALTAGL